jgi:phosphate transport system substrate-binding protein
MSKTIRTMLFGAALSGLSIGLAAQTPSQGAPAASAAAGATLSGAGSTAAAPLYAAMNEDLGLKHRYRLSYEPVGSGEGLKRVMDRKVDFGASERPLSRADLNDKQLVQLPLTVGGVVVTANLPDFPTDQLKLDAEVLAAMFRGQVQRWNDARIAALNPGLSLPALTVTPVFREDSSGTSFLFSAYLSKRSPSWKTEVGVSSTLKTYIVGNGVGASGTGGMARALASKPGAIGYLDFGFAHENKYKSVQLKNGFGSFVAAAPESLDAALRAADWERLYIDTQPTFEIDTVDVGCPRCWPIVGMTYVVAPRRWNDADKVQAFSRFVESLLNDGDTVARAEGYVPLPNRAKNLVRATLRSQVTTGRPRSEMNAPPRVAGAVQPTLLAIASPHR